MYTVADIIFLGEMIGVWILLIGVVLWVIVSYRQGFFNSESERIGRTGESEIVKELRKLVSRNRIFKNVYIDTYGKGKTELDVVMVDQTGIYVIESKNYNGEVSGHVEDTHWEYAHAGGHSYKFYNPIKQNKGHTNAIMNEFGIHQPGIVMSYVVFGGKTTIGRIQGKKSAKVMRVEYLADVLYNEKRQRRNIISKDEVREISRRLRECSNVSLYTKWKHKETVKRKSIA